MMTYAPDLGIKYLVGKKIVYSMINPDHDIILLFTDHGLLYLSWVGEGSAECFIQHVAFSETLCDANILNIKQLAWRSLEKDGYSTIESMGTAIITDKGICAIETRLIHNGYYAGYIRVSQTYPSSMHGGAIEITNIGEFKHLSDF